MDRKNQPGQYGADVNVTDFLNELCKRPSANITAMNEDEMSELTLLGFDITEDTFQGKGQLGISQYGDRLNLPMKSIKEKNMFKVFSGQQLDLINNKVTVTEFANDASQVEAVSAITSANSGEFSDVSGFQATDVVLIVKGSAASATVPAKVKITDVDQETGVITFDTNVTIAQGDYIEYITTDAFGCQNNTKGVAQNSEKAKSFTYNTQFFSREAKVDLSDFNKVFAKESQQYEAFTYDFYGKPTQELYSEVAKSFRHGSGITGASPKIKGYDTIIEERDAAGLESIIDFTGITGTEAEKADKHQKKIEDILYRVNQSPVKSKFVLIGNSRFHRAYKNMMQELRGEAEARATGQLFDTIHDGIMKWNVEEAPMVDFYLSRQLSREQAYAGRAYILPKDLIAGFTPKWSEVEMKGNGSIAPKAAVFGAVNTREKVGQATAECRVYEHYMRLGFIFAGVSYRDTYFRIDDFNFGL